MHTPDQTADRQTNRRSGERWRARWTLFGAVIGAFILAALLGTLTGFAQERSSDATVPVGQGSYTDVLPAGYSGPAVLACNNSGTIVEPQRTATPMVAPGFSKPPQTHDWYSSVIWKANNSWDAAVNECVLHKYSESMHAHPWSIRFELDQGVTHQMVGGYTNYYNIEDQFQGDYRTVQHNLLPDFTLTFKDSNGNVVAVTDTRLADYSDWGMTAYSSDGQGHSWRTTLLEGSPYLFFETTNIAAVELRPIAVGNAFPPAVITATGHSNALGFTFSFANDPGTGQTPNPVRHTFGIFGPAGTPVTHSGDNLVYFLSNLPPDSYFSLAILPDERPATLDFFRRRAYAFPTDARVNWAYAEAQARVTTGFHVTTQLKAAGGDLLNHTLQALYLHQQNHLAAPSLRALTAYSYTTLMGAMRVLDGNAFTTTLTHHGILPILPQVATSPTYTATLNQLLGQSPATTTAPDSYFSGKEMARLAQLALIANQVGNSAARDQYLNLARTTLEDWLTYSGAGDQKFLYRDPTWRSMIAYDAGGFYSDTLLNDHHFHYGYFLLTAAIIAQFDPAWAAPDQWGGMVDLLIKDVANGDRSDTSFPFLRFFAPYAGHSWANGPANAADGNNQESSSEAINFATALLLWGEATDNTALRDLGAYLHATETDAALQYWFNEDHKVYPAQPDSRGRSFTWPAVGMVWGGKLTGVTYFGAAAACVIGINVLPMTGGSLYLGRNQVTGKAVYDFAANAYDAFRCWAPPPGAGQPVPDSGDPWDPIFWQHRSLFEPAAAAQMFTTDNQPWMASTSSGTSPAQVYQWLQNMAALGTVDTSLTADTPLYAVFRAPAASRAEESEGVRRILVVHNTDDTERVVTFSNGAAVTVAANSTVVSEHRERRVLLPLIASEQE